MLLFQRAIQLLKILAMRIGSLQNPQSHRVFRRISQRRQALCPIMLATRSQALAHFLRQRRNLDGRCIPDLRLLATRMMCRWVIKVSITLRFILNFGVVHQTCIPLPSKRVVLLPILRFPKPSQPLPCPHHLSPANPCIPTGCLQPGILFPDMHL